MQRKPFKYRLYPTLMQARLLAQALAVCRYWYNMCIADRKLAWDMEGRSVTKGLQEKTGIYYRITFPTAQAIFSQTVQVVCDDVDKTYQSRPGLYL